MSDKTELPKEDKQLIGKIDELLGQLKTISQSVFELREHASLVLPDVAPVDTKEEVKRVVALVSDCGWKNSQRIIKGEQYDIEKEDERHYYVNSFGFSKEKFAVLSQQEQPKWKEGEFILDKDNLGYVTQVMADRILAVNVDGGWAINIPIESAFNPPKEYVEQHLTKIAREKYPVGTKVKSLYKPNVEDIYFEIQDWFEFEYNEKFGRFEIKGMVAYELWNSKTQKWASIVKEEVKEKFSVEVIERYFANGDHTITISTNNDEKLGIGEANEIATQIKALLQTL
jgi:hypothetical protein